MGVPFLYPVVGVYRIRPPTRARKGPNGCIRIHPCGMFGGRMQYAPTCTRPNFAGGRRRPRNDERASSTDGGALFVPGCRGVSHTPPHTGPKGAEWMYPHSSLRDVWRAYSIRPYPGTRPFMYPAKFAGVRRRPYAIRPYKLSAFRFPRRLRRKRRPM